MAANKQSIFIQTLFAGMATFAMLVLFHPAQPGAKSVGGSGLTRVVADGDDDEAQLQQQLAQQEMQQAEQQAQLDLQQAQQAEQQGLQVEQQATLSVPGS